MTLERSLRGAVAGGIAAAVWAAQQPLDKQFFDLDYDDTELLGKLVTSGPEWRAIGWGLHIQNGAAFGAAYAHARPFLPGPPAGRALLAALAEHAALWPLVRASDRLHPAHQELEPLSGNGRAFAQATWRHLLFGLVLGELERRLNPEDEFEPPGVPVSSNGHGDIEHAAAGAGAQT